MRGHQFLLGFVDAAGGVAVEDVAEGGLVGCGVALAGLPACCGSEENAEPVLIEEALAVVVPDGGELAGAAEALAGFDEAGDVVERDVAEGIDLPPVGVAGRDPGFDAGVFEGQNVAVVAVFVPVDPGDGDHVFGDAGDGGGVGGGDVAPEEQAAVQGSEGGVDGGEEVGVDGAEAALVDVGLGAAGAEFEGLVRADVQEGAGEVFGDLGEPALDERLRAGLAGGDDVAVRSLGEVGVFFILEDVVEMAEGLLLGHDHDVQAARRRPAAPAPSARVSELPGGAARGSPEYCERVLEVRRVEIDLVGGEDFELMLLEGEGREGAAGEIVMLRRDTSSQASRGWWRSRASVAPALLEHLLQGLCAVEDACGGVADDRDGAMTVGGYGAR